MSKEPEYTIDMGELDWTPAERAQARHIADTEAHAATRRRIAEKYRRCRS